MNKPRSAAYVFLLLAGPATAQIPAVTWPEAAWNPRPREGDLVLPLPCGGAMAFRRVATPTAASPLADRATTMGAVEDEVNYSEFPRRAFVAGAFGPAGGADRGYWIAKYEVTNDQWAAVTAAQCPPLPSGAPGRQPRASVAWHEAVAFTVQASGWLARNVPAALPEAEGARAFMRLPTEDEWEYAARGGSAVSESDFLGRLPPMEDGVVRHAWFQGARSARGQARQVGLLEASALGLHDMLGNVSEWVLDPFRLNRIGRPHGLAGGQIARGGDFRTPEPLLRTSMRIEYAPVNAESGQPARFDTVGFRPVLARIAIPDDNAPARLRAAFEEEARGSAAEAEDPVRLMEALRATLPEGPLRAGIGRIEAALQAEARTRRDSEGLAIRAQLEALAQVARQVMVSEARRETNEILARALGDALAQQRQVLAEQAQVQAALPPQARPVIASMGQRVQSASTITAAAQGGLGRAVAQGPQQALDMGESYLRSIRALAGAMPAARIQEEAEVLAQEAAGRSQPIWQNEARRIATTHALAAARGRVPTRDAALADLRAEARRLIDAPATPAPPARR